MHSMMLSLTETNKEQQTLYSLLYKHGESCSFYSLNKGTQQPTEIIRECLLSPRIQNTTLKCHHSHVAKVERFTSHTTEHREVYRVLQVRIATPHYQDILVMIGPSGTHSLIVATVSIQRPVAQCNRLQKWQICIIGKIHCLLSIIAA